jgi:hypothetical protein
MLRAMDSSALDTFRAFRNSLYNCLHRRADALFELTDALLTAEQIPSPVHLSLQPSHRPVAGAVSTTRSAMDESTLKLCGGCSLTIRLPEAKLPYMAWTLACGIVAMRRAVPSVVSTTILPATLLANPS